MSTTYLAIGIYKNLLGEVYTVEIETHLSDKQEVVALLNYGNYLKGYSLVPPTSSKAGIQVLTIPKL